MAIDFSLMHNDWIEGDFYVFQTMMSAPPTTEDALRCVWTQLDPERAPVEPDSFWNQINDYAQVRSNGVKTIDFTPPTASSGRANWPYETVPSRTILRPSEGGRKPRGKNHQALAVEGERHPTCGRESESNPESEPNTKPHHQRQAIKITTKAFSFM